MQSPHTTLSPRVAAKICGSGDCCPEQHSQTRGAIWYAEAIFVGFLASTRLRRHAVAVGGGKLFSDQSWAANGDETKWSF